MVVRDKKGKIVKTLQPGDVEVYEDGVRQQVLSFRLVTGREAQPAAATPAGSGAAAKAKSASLPLRSLNVVCVVFQNVNPAKEKWAVDAAREFIGSDLPADTWVGVFHLDPGLAVLQPFTTDRNGVVQASKNGFALAPVDFAAAAGALLKANPGVVYADEAGLHVSGADLGKSVSIDTSGPTGLATNPQTELMLGMVRLFGILPGRKTVLLLSPGLAEMGSAERLTRVAAAANKAGVTIYSVTTASQSDASGSLMANIAVAGALNAGQTGIAAGGAAPGAMTPTGPPPSVTMGRDREDGSTNDAARTTNQQGVLRSLSEATGGFLIVKSGDRKPFQRIADDMGTHYEAVYHPPSDKYDGRLRKIEIKLARPDLKVESRAGYFAMPAIKGSPLKPFEMAALMALSEKPLPHAFDFRLSAFQFRPEGETSQFGVVYEVPIANLTATPVPGMTFRAVDGTLRELGEKDLFLDATTGKRLLRFRVSADTQFQKEDGSPVRDSLLKPGDRLSVLLNKDDPDTALRVTLSRNGTDSERAAASRPFDRGSAKAPAEEDGHAVSNVGFAGGEQKKHRMHLSLVALVRDADGNVVDKFSQDSAYEVLDENLASARTTPISYSHPLDLPVGRYTIETVLMDQEGHRSTTGEIPISNDERKGLSVSSVILVKQIEAVVGQGDPTDPFQLKGRQVVPEIAPTVAPGAKPYIYFSVYPNKANQEKVTVQIEVLRDGDVIAEQEAGLAAPDSSGTIPVVIGGTPVQAGAYEVRITAQQGDDSAEQSLQYSVAAP